MPPDALAAQTELQDALPAAPPAPPRGLRKLFGASGPLVLSRLASAVVTFGLPLLLARLLDRTQYGTYKQFFLVAQTVLLVGQFGLTQSLLTFLPRGEKHRGAYLLQAMLGLAVAGVVAAVLLSAGAPLLAKWLESPGLVELRWPLALFAGGMLAGAALEPAFTGEGRIARAAVLYAASDALRAGGMIAAALYVGPRALFWAAALLALARVAVLWGFWLVRALPSARPERKALRTQLAFALPFAGASLLLVAQRTFAQYAVSASFDPATFALFSVASFHLGAADIVFTPVAEVLIVELGRARGAPARLEAWRGALRKLSLVLVPAACGAWLLGGVVLPLLFTQRYAGAVPLFCIATGEFLLAVLPADALLRASGETKALFRINVGRLAATAALVTLGIRLGGVAGAMVGGLAAEVCGRFALLVYGRRFLGARLRELVDVRALLPVLFAAAVASPPCWAVRLFVHRPVPLLLASIAVFCAVYFGVLALLGRRGVTRAPVIAAA